MNWYDSFNSMEACLWFGVAGLIPFRAIRVTNQQIFGVALGMVGFTAFGVSDLLELGRAGELPLWLWGFKIACGIVILSARYTWKGWIEFRWHDREFLFGLAMLLGVLVVVYVQFMLDKLPPSSIGWS